MHPPSRIDPLYRRIQTFRAECSTTWATLIFHTFNYITPLANCSVLLWPSSRWDQRELSEVYFPSSVRWPGNGWLVVGVLRLANIYGQFRAGTDLFVYLLVVVSWHIMTVIWENLSLHFYWLMGIYNVPHHVHMVWEELAFDDAVSYI